jgi:hypothetical protein
VDGLLKSVTDKGQVFEDGRTERLAVLVNLDECEHDDQAAMLEDLAFRLKTGLHRDS